MNSKAFVVTLSLLFLFHIYTIAQTPTVTQTQSLSFGSFSINNSGSITINYDGSIITSAGILSLDSDYHQAIFEITINGEYNIEVTYDASAVLTRSSGSETLVLNLGPDDKNKSFLASPLPQVNYLNLGAVLTIGNSTSNPPGSYSGTFSIEFTVVFE